MIPLWAKALWADKFKRSVIIILALLALFLLLQPEQTSEFDGDGLEIHYFYSPTCPHCAEQKVFNEELRERYPEVHFVEHDVTRSENIALFRQFAQEHGIDASRLGVPATFIDGTYNIGFHSEDVTGPKLISMIEDALAGNTTTASEEESNEITLPFLGTINPLDYSLPFLAVVLGIIDGFNPCAMWVLVYLISLIVQLNDRRKIWLLVGSFVFASGVLYFLFMTAWLNVFLLVGYLRPITILIGVFAIGVGIINLYDHYKTKGALVCNVEDVEGKKKTQDRMKQIVESPLSWTVFFGIVALAFIVNGIEFVCSAAIPAVFTHVLALSDLSFFAHYGYILLYVLFFMLDDLIIFGLAAFAVSSTLGTKYAKYSKLIGGLIMLGLGVVIIFFPHLLG